MAFLRPQEEDGTALIPVLGVLSSWLAPTALASCTCHP